MKHISQLISEGFVLLSWSEAAGGVWVAAGVGGDENFADLCDMLSGADDISAKVVEYVLTHGADWLPIAFAATFSDATDLLDSRLGKITAAGKGGISRNGQWCQDVARYYRASVIEKNSPNRLPWAMKEIGTTTPCGPLNTPVRPFTRESGVF